MSDTIYGCSNCLTSRERIDETHYSLAWSGLAKVTLDGEEVLWIIEAKAGEWIIQAVLKGNPTPEHHIAAIDVDIEPLCDCPYGVRGIALMRKVFGDYRVELVNDG